MKRSTCWGALLLGVLGACGIGDETGPFVEGITFGPGDENGDVRMAPVGTVLPDNIRVVVLDTGRPKSGLRINWSASGSGKVSPATGTTDANGVAQTTWTLGAEPGAQFVTAISPEARGAQLVFYATATKDGRSDW